LNEAGEASKDVRLEQDIHKFAQMKNRNNLRESADQKNLYALCAFTVHNGRLCSRRKLRLCLMAIGNHSLEVNPFVRGPNRVGT